MEVDIVPEDTIIVMPESEGVTNAVVLEAIEDVQTEVIAAVDDAAQETSWTRSQISQMLESQAETNRLLYGLANRMEVSEALNLPALVAAQNETIASLVATLTPTPQPAVIVEPEPEAVILNPDADADAQREAETTMQETAAVKVRKRRFL